MMQFDRWKNLKKTGVYILWKYVPQGQLPHTYVGKSDSLKTRLDFHKNDKSFWTHCVVFFSNADNLDAAQAGYLEARLVALAKEAKRCKMKNENIPKIPYLTPPNETFMKAFLHDMLLCLPVIGVSFFEKPNEIGQSNIKQTIEVDPQPPTPPVVSDWIALPKYSFTKNKKAPAAIRFWDNSIRDVKFWYQVLTGTIEKLYGDGLLTVENTPINLGKNRYLIHTEPIHPTGKQFNSIKQVGSPPLYIEVNLDAASVRENATRLLQMHNIDPSTVHLKT